MAQEPQTWGPVRSAPISKAPPSCLTPGGVEIRLKGLPPFGAALLEENKFKKMTYNEARESTQTPKMGVGGWCRTILQTACTISRFPEEGGSEDRMHDRSCQPHA